MISDRNDETVVFLHIPKTAGTTLTEILHGLEPPDKVHAVPVHPVEIPPLDVIMEEFRETPLAQRSRIRLLTGHYPYGIHEAIPRPARYVTMLRDPVSRAVSLYDYIRFHERHPLREVAASMDLRSFVEQDVPGGLHDGQTAFIAGEGIHHPGGDPALLERARTNIASEFACVGIQERFDESLVGFAAALGWDRLPCYERVNVNRSSDGKTAIDAETIALIERCNKLDRVLYDEAAERLETSLAGLTPDVDSVIDAWRHRCKQEGGRRVSLAQVRSAVRLRTRVRSGFRALRGSGAAQGPTS